MSDPTSSSSSDDDENVDEVDEPSTRRTREKRGIAWCAVDTEEPLSNHRPSVTWPPQTSSGMDWRNLRHVRMGNPMFGTKMQLFSKTGQHLAIYHNGGVGGTQDENDLHTYLELINAGFPGHVRIKGLATNAYVGMDKKGRLYTEYNTEEESTIFIESLKGLYSTYLSRKYAHLGWYIGLKRSGKFKRGPKTGYKQKAIAFLPVRAKFQ